MSQVISFLHDKGGCAKTTSCVNLGFALWLLGKKVLLIDTDPQCNMTDTVDKTVHLEAESTIYDWLHDFKPGEMRSLPIYTRYDGLDYVPGSHSMSNINAELQLMYNREHRLANFLDTVDPESGAKIRNMYDYIFIDCAPGGETLMNTNALVASDYVIVPTEAGIYSLQGLPRLLDYIDKVRTQLHCPVSILGYLLVRWNAQKAISREVKAYYSNETGDIEAVRETEVTFESFEPTGSFTSDTPETTELTANFVKSSYVYSVWYDVTSDNPADYSSITSDKAYALKGETYQVVDEKPTISKPRAAACLNWISMW